MKKILISVLALFPAVALAQNKDLRVNLNEDGSHYFKFMGLSQVWLRYDQSNPGSTMYGDEVESTYDIGIRRLRFQAYGQLSDRVFVYTQFGQNNLNRMASRKTGGFFHDAIVEYAAVKRKLSLGAGMTGWSGLSRYASPSVGSILSLDAPLYQQATNDINDIFLRKLSVYAKGKLGKLDYRVAITNPFPVQSATTGINGSLVGAVDTIITTNSTFNPRKAKAQFQGYFMYQFKDEESNLTPYTTGTYHGKKDVFNIGVGFIYQAQATRRALEFNDSLGFQGGETNDMLLLCVDMFYDHPINEEKGTALTLYGSFSSYDFGPGYLRYTGVMNPTNGLTTGNYQKGNNGNAFPMIGTGQIIYIQGGYKLKNELFGKQGTLQPYADMMLANYDRLNGPMAVYEAGINWLITGHSAKMTLGLQNRPVFNPDLNGTLTEQGRKSMITLQYQISI